MRLDFLLLTAVVVVLALLGSSHGFGQRKIPAGVRLLTETGTVFIVVGALIGPRGFNLLSARFLGQLTPILVLGFGWIGFLYGSHFEWRRMRRFRPRMYAAGMTESFVALVVISAAAWLAIPLLQSDLKPALRVVMALALGICGAGTAPAGVFLLSSTRQISLRDVRVLKFFSAIDDLPAVVSLGVLTATVYPMLGPSLLTWWQRLILAASTGVLLGAITHWLFPRTGDVRHNTLVLLGMAALGAGAAVMMGLSALFVSVIAGTVFANLSPRKESAYGLMAAREHTLYAVFLLVAGAMFRFEGGSALWVLVPGYVVLRGFGKLIGAFLARGWISERQTSPLLGAGLLYQGGIPVVIAVHFEHFHGAALAHLFMTTFILGVIINDLIASPIAVGVLHRERR